MQLTLAEVEVIVTCAVFAAQEEIGLIDAVDDAVIRRLIAGESAEGGQEINRRKNRVTGAARGDMSREMPLLKAS